MFRYREINEMIQWANQADMRACSALSIHTVSKAVDGSGLTKEQWRGIKLRGGLTIDDAAEYLTEQLGHRVTWEKGFCRTPEGRQGKVRLMVRSVMNGDTKGQVALLLSYRVGSITHATAITGGADSGLFHFDYLNPDSDNPTSIISYELAVAQILWTWDKHGNILAVRRGNQ